MTLQQYGKSQDKIRIGVIGLGFVGLPLALLFNKKGYNVTGIDLDNNKIEKLRECKSYLPDTTSNDLKEAFSTDRFNVTYDYHQIVDMNVIIICVPTPLTSYNTPDLSYLQAVSRELSPLLQKDQLVVLESSSYPGTTREVIQPILEESGLDIGEDLFLAYSPERIDPGNKAFQIEEIPKVVSGITEMCKSYTYHLYSHVFNKVVMVSSTEIAEFTKLLENSYRFINISFINELSILCDTLNIDIWEVINAASTKPYGFIPFYPGPGIGGHCIPIDPIYLSWKSKQAGLDNLLLNTSDKINRFIPRYIVNQIQTLISSSGKIEEARILICGVTYKKDIDDVRESTAITIIHSLLQIGAHVDYYDPYVPELHINDKILSSQPLSKNTLQNMDCVILLTDHSHIPIQHILDHSKIVYDTRNATSGLNSKAKIIRFGGGEI